MKVKNHFCKSLVLQIDNSENFLSFKGNRLKFLKSTKRSKNHETTLSQNSFQVF